MKTAEVGLEEQRRFLLEKEITCLTLIQQDNYTQGIDRCPRTWDGVLCWPATVNGTTATAPCPDYVNGANIGANASKTCDGSGHWYIRPDTNSTWTNLTLCFSEKYDDQYEHVPEIIATHMPRIRLMYNIGYGISLAALIFAVGIMVYIKRLHCPRNTIHINLFLSFILRAIISFVKENALVNGVGFSFDVEQSGDGKIRFLPNSPHWECKTFFSVFNYILGANYMWIFTEGIYLHMLITVAMFSERSGIKRLVLFGWGTPVLCVIPWVIVRATQEDVLCWNTHPTNGYFWLIRGPIVAAMGINFFIFLNIVRVLFTKLNAFNTPNVNRKLAKSTLVLIPLFGVHYIVFIGLPNHVDETTELVKLYYEMFFNSFQGFFVSLLFCFLNGEVQAEIQKKWKRFILKRGGHNLNRRHTLTSFVSNHRASSASSDRDQMNGKVTQKCDNIQMTYFNGSSGPSEYKNGTIPIKGRISDKVCPESHPLVVMNSSTPNKDLHDDEVDAMMRNSSNSITTDDIMNLDLV
ncbi:parathyroid hormone/parathyroid hormone-related peptide receptor-like isoform X2 [Mya arenaria]|uniref:parathyroid hormone/parathyroid hormone-related peptide receptor-like isoform X2 n=1 Tax=Mya arenaria TaxID=6604 RepID=UPI0022E44BCD|nr:parathyroid hormone/parathyroid hormone-related peptide receptor-like isoform X2 [Mya arenaria]